MSTARVCKALAEGGMIGVCVSGKVAKGFGRGAKMLGFPTANLDDSNKSVADFLSRYDTGVYFGWGRVVRSGTRSVNPVPRENTMESLPKDDSSASFNLPDEDDSGVYKVALSVGWNPTFTDVPRKLMEVYIMHKYDFDFYGEEVRVVICGFLRPELAFKDVETLIEEINEDCKVTEETMEKEEFKVMEDHPFLKVGVDSRI